MFCPKCRTKYLDGISVCENCGVHLVQELPLPVARTILLVMGSFIFYIIMCFLIYREVKIVAYRLSIDIFLTIILILISFVMVGLIILILGVKKEIILKTVLVSFFNGFFSSGYIPGCMISLSLLGELKEGFLGDLFMLSTFLLYIFIYRYVAILIIQKSKVAVAMVILLSLGSIVYVIFKFLFLSLPI